jgi:predicted O-linked N-acetylglucosamine transferase (SPINDLY family)
MTSPDQLFDQAFQIHMRGDLESAAEYYREILTKHPNHAETLHHLGLAKLQRGEIKEAINWIRRSVEVNDKQSNVLSNLGYCLNLIGNHEEALSVCDKSISLNAKNDGAWTNLGNAQKELRLTVKAQQSYEKALELQPNNPRYFYNLANALYDLKSFDEAKSLFEKTIALEPRIAEAHNNLAACLIKLKKFCEALPRTIAAIELKPDYAEAWSNRGNALNDLKRHEEALASYDRSIELKPDYAEAWSNRGNTLNNLKRHEEAAKCFLRAYELSEIPDFHLGRCHYQMMLTCDWTDYDLFKKKIDSGIKKGKHYAEPFGFQGIADSEQLLKICAELFCQKNYPTETPIKPRIRNSRQKIRIGYLCGEFRNQATSHLMTGVWESHNPSRYEIFAFDNGWDDGSEYRTRIKSAIPNFFDISRIPDRKVAELISEKNIDILINLNGYFGHARQGVFAAKPSPIAVNYLGFPGTIGADYIDYLIADQICIPESSKDHYAEKIVYLPFSYQANDNLRKASTKPITRSEFGLPKNVFVFCCFNNNYKVTPRTFQIWIEILSEVEHSCLWLLEDNLSAKTNLRNETSRRGIDPNRLIFAKRLESSEHINRHRLADLFLDTLPYNAHTTASDALWAGLPVLTLKGNTFPGRVGASLLTALNLPELITNSAGEYKNVAISLAKSPEKLASVKEKLAQNKLSTSLFDTSRFTRNLESAYEAMYERYRAKLPPDHIHIQP